MYRTWTRVVLILILCVGVMMDVDPVKAEEAPEPVAAIVPTPSGLGYLIVTEAGRVFAYGDAPDLGNLIAIGPLDQPIVGGSFTTSGGGYWLWARDGGVFGFGDAEFFGSMGGIPLTEPVVGGAPTPTGNGYWLWARDGGVFTFGDATFYGSMGATPLDQPIVGGGPTPAGRGYWLWAADGGAFTFGDAEFFGSLGGLALDQPIIAGGRTATGDGYLFMGADGGSFTFGDAVFPGSSAERHVIFTGGAVTPAGDGLWLVTDDGFLEVLGSAPRLGSPQAGPVASPAPPPDEVTVEIVTFGTSFTEPVDITSRPGDSDAIYVAERNGRVRRVLLANPMSRDVVLDITSLTTTNGERGLLGIAFSADGSKLYLHHTNLDSNLRVAEYTMIGDTATARRDLFGIDQPFGNHNGGDIAIGPDGYLYLTSGDGGSGGDPENNAQDLSNLLGAIVRVDPTEGGGQPYTIPPDNPFVQVPGARPEIWALGLRNPWRFDFDSAGNLWIADVGQSAWEEIDVIPAGDSGLNFGWRIREGAHPFNGTDPGGLIDPVFEYDHDSGCSVTGGVLVEDPRLTDFLGDYLFSDFCQPSLRILRLDGLDVISSDTIAELPSRPVSFGEGPNDRIYVATLDGTIVRIDPV